MTCFTKMVGGIGLLLSVCLLTGCAMSTREVDVAAYSRTTADETMADCRPPDYVVHHEAPRVAILQFDDHSETELNLGKLATEAFHTMTADMGRFQVIERAQADKFVQELGYQEEHGGSWEDFEANYMSLGQDVDYVIVGAVKRVMPNVDRKPAAFDSEGNQTLPPRCEAKVEVSVSARVVNTHTGLTVRTFEMQDSVVQKQNTGCQATPGMAIKALEKAIEFSGSVEMAQAIPLYGYVKRLLSCNEKKERIAYISLGRCDGIKPGDEIAVMKSEEDIDPISGKRDVRFIDIVKGCVAKNGLCETESIVIFDDEMKAPMIKLGHVVSPTASRAIAEANNQKIKEVVGNIIDTAKTLLP